VRSFFDIRVAYALPNSGRILGDGVTLHLNAPPAAILSQGCSSRSHALLLLLLLLLLRSPALLVLLFISPHHSTTLLPLNLLPYLFISAFPFNFLWHSRTSDFPFAPSRLPLFYSATASLLAEGYDRIIFLTFNLSFFYPII
jgi:hypothetical protein